MQEDLNSQDKPVETDEIDNAILALLVQDGRMSARAVGRQIGMSPNAISERIERLQHKGVITGYHAELDPDALGYGMLAVVGLQTLHGPAMTDTIDQILEIPEVEAVYIVTGQWDLILEVRVRSHAHLERVLLERVWQIKAFRHSETMIALRSYRRDGPWLPPPLRGPRARRPPRSS